MEEVARPPPLSLLLIWPLLARQSWLDRQKKELVEARVHREVQRHGALQASPGASPRDGWRAPGAARGRHPSSHLLAPPQMDPSPLLPTTLPGFPYEADEGFVIFFDFAGGLPRAVQQARAAADDG